MVHPILSERRELPFFFVSTLDFAYVKEQTKFRAQRKMRDNLSQGDFQHGYPG